LSDLFSVAALPRLDGSEADGIHLMWTAPPAAGYSLDGWDIQRREASGRPKVQCYRLSGDELEILHRVLRLHTPTAEIGVRQADCPTFPQLPDAGPHVDDLLPAVGPAAIGTAPGRRCVAYDIRLLGHHRVVEVHIGVPAALAIALRGGKGVAARTLVAPSGTQSTRFDNLDVDQVLVYCAARASLLEICRDEAPDPDEEEQEWAGEPFVAKGIQVPIRALDPGLGSQGDEDALAKSRLLPGEDFPAYSFHDAAESMNAAAGDAAHTAPGWASTVVREDLDDPLVELRPWGYTLAMLIEPTWRRMLGFGFLDPAGDLEAGKAYDYRVTGRFRRRDVDESLHGFHSIPRGTTLPTAFALGSVSLRAPAPATVEQLPEPPEDGFSATGRKGIALAGERCLTLSFPAPVTRVALELAPGASLSWKASTTDFLPGIPTNSFGGDLPPDRRVTIATPDPVDTIRLSGGGFLFGIRESPVASPDDVVTRSAVLNGVVLADTPVPEPPAFLGTDNLQQPSLPSDPGSGPPPAPASLGFRLSWLPPPPAGSPGPVPWPADLDAFPPFDVLGFRIERRRVDTSGPFEGIDGAELRTLVLGSRGGHRDPPPLAPGIDLEAAFPNDPPPAPPLSPVMELDDVLVTSDHSGPPPGSTHEYRIFSVDAIGRSSASARAGPVVRLEKRQPPPQPVGPPAPPAGGPIAPSGVRARVLQALDPDLADADRELLDDEDNAVVLEWGWTEAEREADPHAREFRVYWQALAPDVVTGAVTGAPALVGGLFELPAELDRPLEADAMRGRYLALPDYPFKVASHDAGQSIALRVEPSAIDSSRTPGPAVFEFRPVLDGAEQRPPAWAERSAVVPITDAAGYQHVFRDRLTLDADSPRARVWAGASAADDQAYVADALDAAVPNGGRPGNESAIAAAAADARYLGRPELTVAPPLPDVPELVTDEPAGETVTVVVDLPGLLPDLTVPAGHRVQFERLGLDRIADCLGANQNDTISATLPGGTATSYTQSNPDDQAELLAQIRSGTPARVEGRFLIDFLVRFGQELEPLWVSALPDPVPYGALTDTLPHKAERYVHRVRLADAAGHLSAGGAIPEQIVRVPSLRSPGPPELSAPSSDDDDLAIEVRVRDAFDLSWVVLFAATEEAPAPVNDNVRAPAQLLRLPNRRDLYPNEGIRVRVADGGLLAPVAALDVDAGALDGLDRVVSATVTPGHDRRVALWSLAMTRDGITSRLAGPVVALTGPPPLEPPELTVTRAGGTDTVSWDALAVPALLSLGRSEDGGASWDQVTPWLPQTATSYTLPSTSGDVRYRASLRADRGRRATGPEAVPS
jgi:hypothetical protein